MASTEAVLPKPGELWLVSFGASRDGEPTKNRPALVLSSDELLTGSGLDLVIVTPLSATLHPAMSRPPVPAGTGLERASVVIPRAVRAVALGRLLRRLGEAPADTLDATRRILADLIGLEA